MIVLNDNEVAVGRDEREMRQWLIAHGCTEIEAGLMYCRFYRFPSDAVRNWFILRWV